MVIHKKVDMNRFCKLGSMKMLVPIFIMAERCDGVLEQTAPRYGSK